MYFRMIIKYIRSVLIVMSLKILVYQVTIIKMENAFHVKINALNVELI